jgi:hypothetical protein
MNQVGQGGHDRFVHNDELESDDRSPLVLRSNPVAAAFAFDLQIWERETFADYNREWEDNACIT